MNAFEPEFPDLMLAVIDNSDELGSAIGLPSSAERLELKIENINIDNDDLLLLQNESGMFGLNQSEELLEKTPIDQEDPLTGTGNDVVEQVDSLTGETSNQVEIQTKAGKKRDQAGNSRRKAYNFGVLEDGEKLREFVGRSDRKDFYKFKVNEKTDVDIELRGLSGNADLYLLNNKGKVIEKSVKGGKKVEDIEQSLNPGNYYIRVQSKNKRVNANYTLSLDRKLPDIAGNRLNKAYDLEVLQDDRNIQEFVGKSDRKDFYKFNVNEKTDVDIELRDLTGNADLYLLNNKGKVLDKSVKGGKKVEDIEQSLNPGNYYVRVQSKNKRVNADYSLSLETTPLETTPIAETLEKYEFIYYSSGSQDDESQDYYNGYVYAPQGTYEVDSYYDFYNQNNEVGANGKYYISSSSSSVADENAKEGEVYLETYYDLEKDQSYTSYTPYYASGGFASGTGGLGSEKDYIGAEFGSAEDAINLNREEFFGEDKYVADYNADIDPADIEPEDDPSPIDLMVVYTPEALEAEGGAAGMNDLIQDAVDKTNDAFANSGVKTKLNLVHTVQVDYTESGNSSTELKQLKDRDDGDMDEVHQLRDQYGADIVSLFVSDLEDSAGIASIMPKPGYPFEDHAFNVVVTKYAASNYSLAHEIGHNLGLAHNRKLQGSPAALPYGYGYTTPSGVNTIMSDPNNRVGYFSNPTISYNGEALGRENSENSALAINQVAKYAARWGESK